MSAPNISSQFIPGDSFSDTALIIKVAAVLFNLLWYRNAGGKKEKRRSECIEPLYDSLDSFGRAGPVSQNGG